MDINVKVANVYNMMTQRCYNDKMTGYENYGGRGYILIKNGLIILQVFFNGIKKTTLMDAKLIALITKVRIQQRIVG